MAIDAITSGDTAVVLPHPEHVDGNVSLLELMVLARLVRERAPRELFEIGTFNGRTTSTLAANAPDDAKVHTLDLPAGATARLEVLADERRYIDKPRSGELLRESAHARKVTQHFGDSATFDLSRFEVDFVFVDGSHSYEYVRSDSERALSMLRSGSGTIVWHDYGEWEGVTRALDDLAAGDSRFHALRHVEGTTLVILDA